ncbi:hypothetical protein VFPFJ_08673 [Purpureocillium lilacinum]|uniref:Uncharacterized protein n=1 Tax=Purpureocillium lilacinum TaxID=33203 RepID=A0A179GB90_PURLI|nr:hypothetical protein VFPFJ_08673 [Purpureocillium lilacinum]OAQ74760.1 hypothetical protein VFPBJ_10055 [Purpureocillium lilacinum]OAQ82870.1 hypothetical protein VFPFJ_08673 [Purpureocillium lilacinum]
MGRGVGVSISTGDCESCGGGGRGAAGGGGEARKKRSCRRRRREAAEDIPQGDDEEETCWQLGGDTEGRQRKERLNHTTGKEQRARSKERERAGETGVEGRRGQDQVPGQTGTSARCETRRERHVQQRTLHFDRGSR